MGAEEGKGNADLWADEKKGRMEGEGERWTESTESITETWAEKWLGNSHAIEILMNTTVHNHALPTSLLKYVPKPVPLPSSKMVLP